jgi:hypothetical protein
MWLSNSKKYAMDRFWKIVHHVGSCIMWDRCIMCGGTVLVRAPHQKSLSQYQLNAVVELAQPAAEDTV